VSELAEALKRCQDEKKIADEGKKIVEDALDRSMKDLEKLQKNS
jgi:hypothetical protein